MALFTIDHVGLLLHKLKEVQYEAKDFGIKLGLKNSDIEAIYKQNKSHKTPRECLQQVFSLWLKQPSKHRTWAVLLQALRRDSERVIANTIERRYTLDQSVSVPLHDLLSLVEGINTTHWRSLGLNLGLPLSQINEIDDRGGWSEYMMIELLSLWVRGNGKPATLDTLVTAVRELQNFDLAERLTADSDLIMKLSDANCLQKEPWQEQEDSTDDDDKTNSNGGESNKRESNSNEGESSNTKQRIDLTPPVAPTEQNNQGRSLKSDVMPEVDTSGAVIPQSSINSDIDSVLESTVITASNFVLHSPSDLCSLLQKYNLSKANVEKQCDDHLFLTLLPQLSNLEVTAPYFELTRPEIEEIRNHKTRERSRNISMLWKWRKKNGSDATYLAIVQVFLCMKDQNLAEIVLQHFKARFQHQPKTIKSRVYPEKAGYENWDRKSPAEREVIKNLLFKQNENIREKFAYLTDMILDSFKSRNVELNRLKMFLYSYGIPTNIPTPTNATLLPHFQNATNLEELFLILCRDNVSWFNIQLLKVIVKKHGTKEDQKHMKAYEDDLADYLKQSIYKIPSKSYAPGHKNAYLIFLYLLLPNNVLPTGEDVEDITRNISQLLGISDGIVQFIGFKNCSILLKFGVPKQLLHVNTLRSFIEMYFNPEKKGYTFIGDLSLLWPFRNYDDDSALKRSKIETTESIVTRDIPLTSSSNMDVILAGAFNEGGGKLKTCNVMLHGPPGVGKSSLKRLILGYPPLQREQQNATGIIENAVRAVSTNLLAGGRQRLTEVNDVELVKMLAKQVKFLHLSSDTLQEIYSHDSSDQHIPETHEKISFQPFDTKSSPLPSTSQLIRVSSSATMTSIKEQLVEQVEHSNEIYDDNWIHLIDSGGCLQFLDVFPHLYHNESFHIVLVVTRLDEGLDDKPRARFYKKGNDVNVLPEHLMLSNREFIERACQKAEAQATSRKFVPKVMVIGTYKHKLGIDGEAKLKKINKELTKIHQKYSRVLIRKSKDELIFAVNAMAPVGEERQLYTEELQECILKAAQDTRYEIDVPLKWFAFYLDLNKTGGVVRKAECYNTGEILGMKKTDVEEALKYFNRVGLLLQYADDFPDLIFTKIDQLTSRISRLITASFITPGSSTVTAPYDRLRQKGLFNKSFLPTIFEDLDNSEKDFHDDDFLKLLVCLKIAVHVGDDDYFLPSALSLEPPVDDSPFPMSCVPLAFIWDEQILPHGFFLTFVVELLRLQESADKLYFELREDVIQCRYVIQVTVAKKKIPGFLKLVDRKRWIEICYSSSRTSTRHCSKLREITSDAVERVVKKFEHTGIKSPEIGFHCSLCDTNDHYCILSHDYSTVSCSRSDGLITPDMSCWLERYGSSQYSVSHMNLTTEYSPFNVFKTYISEMLAEISDTERLANDLSSADLIPYCVKDDVLTTNLSRYQKASKLLNEFHRLLKVSNKPETLISWCEVLKNQVNPALTRIVEDMLMDLGSSQYSVSHTTDNSPRNIFKRHMSEMLDEITDTEKLACDLLAVDLIPYHTKNDIITTNLPRYQKASILLNEIERSLRVFNKPEMLISCCEVFKKQENPALRRIAADVLRDLSSSQYSVSDSTLTTGIKTHVTSSSHTTSFSEITANCSPHDIFKRHMSEMLGVISDTERLANDLSSADLISYHFKDDVINVNESRYQKASKLLNKIVRLLRDFNKPEILISCCEVLKKQMNPALTRIADDMLKDLGSSEYSVSDINSTTDYSPCIIFMRHMSEGLCVISDIGRLASDLSSVGLISDQVKDDITTKKVLLNEIMKSLRDFNKPEVLISYCEVLKKPMNPDLTRIAEYMLKDLEYSPSNIFKKHMSEMLDEISDIGRLANDFSSADLISYSVKDDVLTVTNRSCYQKASKLLNAIERVLRVFNKPEILISCCEVLKEQDNPVLRRIAKDILRDLGSSQYSVSGSTHTTGIKTHVTSSSHTTSFSQITADCSPHDIFKRHMSEMLGVISDTERLANDLSSADLIPYSVKDEVITTNLSRYQKASKLLHEIERLLRLFNTREKLISYCEVLRKQDSRSLARIAQAMLVELD